MRTFWQDSPNLITCLCTFKRICVPKICFLITNSTVRYGTGSVRTELYSPMLSINSEIKNLAACVAAVRHVLATLFQATPFFDFFFLAPPRAPPPRLFFELFFSATTFSAILFLFSRSSFSDFFWMDITLKMSRQVWGGAWT